MRPRIRPILVALTVLFVLIAASLSANDAEAGWANRPVTKSAGTTAATASDNTGSQDTPTPEDNSGAATATKTPVKAKATKAAATPTSSALVDGGVLNPDEPQDGVIDANHVIYSYSFDGTKGDQITITVEAKDGLAALVTVLPPDGVTFSKNKPFLSGAASEGSNAEIPITVPGDGTYLIAVTGSNNTSGSFTITLSSGQASNTNGNGDNGNAPATIDISGTSAQIITKLQAANLAPKGGKQVLTLPTSFGTTSDPGFSFLTIGRGLSVQEIVLNFQVSWNSAGTSSACGIVFRAADDNNYSSVFLTNDNKAVILQRQNKKNIVDYEKPSKLFAPNTFNTVTMIALQDQMTLYVNGKLETVQKGAAARGGFAIDVYNATDNTVVTDCRYRTIWVWSFDK